MELRDVMADVILARIAKQVEFGLVGTENGPVRRYPLQRDDAILKKVLEILRVLAELSFDPLALGRASVPIPTAMARSYRPLGRYPSEYPSIGNSTVIWKQPV
jgi:hypothetical protein